MAGRRILCIAFAAALLLLPLSSLAGGRLLGDVNNDGNISSLDAALVLRQAVKLTHLSGASYYAADVNGVDGINALDAALILRHVVKLNPISGEVGLLPPMIEDLTITFAGEAIPAGGSAPAYLSYTDNFATPQFTAVSTDTSVLTVSLTGNELALKAVSAGTAFVEVTEAVSHEYASIKVTVVQRDEAVLQKVAVGLFDTNDLSLLTATQRQLLYEVYDYINDLTASDPYTAVLKAGLSYMGYDYSVMDCSAFTKQAYRDCGYGSSVICAGSDNQINLFRNNNVLYDITYLGDGSVNYMSIKPGAVLLWVDGGGEGNHSALYLGYIHGVHYLMESTNSQNGVCIRKNWGTYDKWRLAYYALPLG